MKYVEYFKTDFFFLILKLFKLYYFMYLMVFFQLW